MILSLRVFSRSCYYYYIDGAPPPGCTYSPPARPKPKPASVRSRFATTQQGSLPLRGLLVCCLLPLCGVVLGCGFFLVSRVLMWLFEDFDGLLD